MVAVQTRLRSRSSQWRMGVNKVLFSKIEGDTLNKGKVNKGVGVHLDMLELSF